MEASASAGTRDDSGMSALTLMVTKMPSVVSNKVSFRMDKISLLNEVFATKQSLRTNS